LPPWMEGWPFASQPLEDSDDGLTEPGVLDSIQVLLSIPHRFR